MSREHSEKEMIVRFLFDHETKTDGRNANRVSEVLIGSVNTPRTCVHRKYK